MHTNKLTEIQKIKHILSINVVFLANTNKAIFFAKTKTVSFKDFKYMIVILAFECLLQMSVEIIAAILKSAFTAVFCSDRKEF